MRLAWEKAAEAHDYDFYLWLNDDTALLEGAIRCLIDDIGVCGGGIIAGAVSDPETGRVCYGACNHGGMIVPDGRRPVRADRGMNGNILMLGRDAYKKIGMIDGHYSHGFGDYDYGMMAVKNGVPIHVSSKMLGTCRFNKGKTGSTADMSMRERLGLLFSPLGFPLADTWYYRRKFHGTARALASCLHVMWLVLSGKR